MISNVVLHADRFYKIIFVLGALNCPTTGPVNPSLFLTGNNIFIIPHLLLSLLLSSLLFVSNIIKFTCNYIYDSKNLT